MLNLSDLTVQGPFLRTERFHETWGDERPEGLLKALQVNGYRIVRKRKAGPASLPGRRPRLLE
jgi:hypothetical protein